MKTLLLSAIALTITANVQARSIMTYKPVFACQTYEKGEPVKVEIKEAQDQKQALLVITYPLKGGEQVIATATKTVPPRMMNGGKVVYAGSTIESKEKVSVSYASGVQPIKVGKLSGKAATLQFERKDAVKLICVSAK